MSWYNVSSLRKRLLLLIFLAFFPALLIMLYSGAEQRRVARQNVQDKVISLLQPISVDFKQILGSSNQLLMVLSQMPAVRDQNSAAATALFRDLMERNPSYALIAAVDLSGHVFASGIPTSGSVNLSDRSYIQDAIKTNGFAIGQYQIGRITHKATINAAYPIRDSAQRVTGVVFAAIDLAYISKSLNGAQLPKGSIINVIDTKGTILVSQPSAAGVVGESFPLSKSVVERKTGTLEAMGLDGVRRLYAFMPLAARDNVHSAYLVGGVPLRAIYADANASLLRNIALMIAAFILTLVISWVGINLFVIKKIDGLMEVTGKISAGQLHARTSVTQGNDELDQLARRFDDMAESVEQLTRRNQLILSSAGEGIYGLDKFGKITFVNPAAAYALGYSIDELIGKDAAIIECPDNSPAESVSPLCTETASRVQDGYLWRKNRSSFPVNYVKAPIFEKDSLVGAVVVFTDITEQKKLEDHKRDFYRRTILAATEGKLVICDKDEIEKHVGQCLKSFTIKHKYDLSEVRQYVWKTASELGMNEDRISDFVLCVGEATTNVLKHAGEGTASLNQKASSIVFVVADEGPGILEINLPEVALKRGYTTAISLGMGYKAMISLADYVYLATGPGGTTVAMEMQIKALPANEQLINNLPDTWAGN